MNELLSIFISLNLMDNFTKQIFQSSQAVKELSQNIQQAQKTTKSLQETFKKTFSPETITAFSERLEDISAKSFQSVGGVLGALTASLKSFESMEQARVEMEVAFMTKTGLPKEMEELDKI